MSSSVVFSLPNGLDEIIKVYGLPPEDIDKRSIWELENLVEYVSPFGVPCSYDLNKTITTFRIHKKIYNIVNNTFSYLLDKKYNLLIKDFGGAYVYRRKRGGSNQLSTHSFGIAVDINCLSNKWGEIPTQPYFLVDVFLKFGWIWGGFWKYPDGMHFQYARGY